MRKQRIIFIVVFILFGLIYWYFKYVDGWLEFRKNTDTPKEFLSHTLIKKGDYSKDSIEVLKQLTYLLHKHQESFFLKDYFDSTLLIIDTILYSPNFNKLAIFVITKNPTYRQLMPNNHYNWYYYGYCYLGIREKKAINLTWINGGYGNFYDKDDLASSLRQFYFRHFVYSKEITKAYAYNLNDKRFWDCPIWEKIIEEKLKKKRFEEEEKNYP